MSSPKHFHFIVKVSLQFATIFVFIFKNVILILDSRVKRCPVQILFSIQLRPQVGATGLGDSRTAQRFIPNFLDLLSLYPTVPDP